MKLEIIISILFDLLSNKTVTTAYLAKKYQVSQRSIYRYISCLENANVPIYTNRGRYGGFALVDTYKLSSTFMTKTEFDKTIESLSSIVQNVPDKVLSSALSKLKSTVKHEYKRLDIKSGTLIIDAGRWGDCVGYKSKLNVISDCANQNKRLLIKYHDRNGLVTERKIEPHFIVLKQGLWYVYAFCNLRNKFRFFKLGRIENAMATSETFTRQNITKDDLPLDFWGQEDIIEHVEFKISKRVLSDVEEWLGIENVENVGGEYFAKAKLPIDKGLVSKIMTFGDGIKVLFPAKLQHMIKDSAQKLLNCYDD